MHLSDQFVRGGDGKAELTRHLQHHVRVSRHGEDVEDDPIVMQVTALMMKSKGLRVSKAKTSEECKNTITSGIDVVLMDVFLSGESGVELAQELRKSGYRGLIIGMSAESKALEDIAIFDKTILKPLSLESLNTLMKQIEGH